METDTVHLLLKLPSHMLHYELMWATKFRSGSWHFLPSKFPPITLLIEIKVISLVMMTFTLVMIILPFEGNK